MYAKVRAALAVFGLVVLFVMGEVQIGKALFQIFHFGQDTTDTDTKRSGMALFTDAKTGCEYLGSPFGGITPRLNYEGKQICNRM